MDLPDSGAVFTLGKAYLTDTPQNYFYIKNDPIRRIIAGPKQSAVICDSGRIFCWGENDCGQLAIDGTYRERTNNANNNNNSNNNNINNGNSPNINNNNNNGRKNSTNTHHQLIIKPTCVRALKTLGIRVTDCAFGNGWSVMLTSSNELFFSGRQVFATNKNSAERFPEQSHFQGKKFGISRKPFRLNEYDNFLANSEEPENFVSIKAGFEHFIVQTSFGRLIGWGSNKDYQLGTQNEYDNETNEENEELLAPIELILDAPVKYFVCGPQSTLILTQTDSLYLTGCLNDFKFTQFTRLQQNLSPTEHIEFMHISITNEIFVVTNAGNIYRSKEMANNKLFVFQRFHDYDSLENGPIWKILRGDNFFAALTKSHRFFTTFSESGHHLKTFREISKFKNLRLLDMALGEEHVLVFGVQKSLLLANSFSYMSQTYLLNIGPKTMNNDHQEKTKEIMDPVEVTQLKMTPETQNVIEELTTEKKPIENSEMLTLPTDDPVHTDMVEKPQTSPKQIVKELIEEQVDKPKSTASNKSLHVQLPPDIMNREERTPTPKRLIRQNTPYPAVESEIPTTSTAELQPLNSAKSETVNKRNLDTDVIGGNVEDHLEHTSPHLVNSLEDLHEDLQEITKTSISTFQNEYGEESIAVETVNGNPSQDIRFINDGVDVTERAEKQLKEKIAAMRSKSQEENDVDEETVTETGKANIFKDAFNETKQVLEQSKRKLENMGNETKLVLEQSKRKLENIGKNLVNIKTDDNDDIGNTEELTTKESTVQNDEDNKTLLENSSKNLQLLATREDDEGTTASMKSNHNSHDNPFDTVYTNPFEVKEIDDDNAIIERGKHALQQELQMKAQQVLGINSQTATVTNKTNTYMRQFYDDLKKNISCKSENNVVVISDQQNSQSLENAALTNEERLNYKNNQSKVCNIL